MNKRLNTVRLSIAALALLAAAIAYHQIQDDSFFPRERGARVKPADFWAAVSRANVTQRPVNIVVYPERQGVELITCDIHLTGTPAVSKYVLAPIAPGQPTVESRLASLQVPFTSPHWHNAQLRTGAWIGVAVAAAMLLISPVVGLAQLLARAAQRKSAPAPRAEAITSEDLAKIRAMESELAASLAHSADSASATHAATISDASDTAPAADGVLAEANASAKTATLTGPARLTGAALAPPPAESAESKDYRGEYYPVAKPAKGFSLSELLIVLGLLGMLLALLAPTLAGARTDANQIACAANLRSIGQAIALYEDDNNGYIPASYSYNGQVIIKGVQRYSSQGYLHWSDYLYTSGAIPLSAFLCPELDQGGLPPTNTTPDNLLPGQVPGAPGTIDAQAPRNAYTLNEALSPRNKFTLKFQSGRRIYQLVKASSAPNSVGTILGTEWGPYSARFAADPEPDAPVASSGSTGGFYLYSHRPVHGFVGLDGTLDMFRLRPGVGYRRVTASDLDPDPSTQDYSVDDLTIPTNSTTRLDWVGRNHGKTPGYPDRRLSNFLYLDGHVECKSIYDTLAPFEWGEKFFSLVPNNDLQQ